MRSGDDWVRKHNRNSLRVLGTVGEPINPEAWRWYHEIVGNGEPGEPHLLPGGCRAQLLPSGAALLRSSAAPCVRSVSAWPPGCLQQ